MKNKNNLLKRICVLFLSACFVFVPFCASGCVPMLLGGNWIEDLNDQLENGEITQEEYDNLFKEHSGGVELDGIKVLRRPETYDYDGNVSEGGSNYYYQFSADILKSLTYFYGYYNEDEVEEVLDGILLENGILLEDEIKAYSKYLQQKLYNNLPLRRFHNKHFRHNHKFLGDEGL